MLTKEILCAYLPYEVGVKRYDFLGNLIKVLNAPLNLYDLKNTKNLKLILRPKSDLTKEIEHNGERFVPIERISEMFGIDIITDEKHCLVAPITLESYNVVKQLHEWHFDTFNCIANGYAIDINKIGGSDER